MLAVIAYLNGRASGLGSLLAVALFALPAPLVALAIWLLGSALPTPRLAPLEQGGPRHDDVQHHRRR